MATPLNPSLVVPVGFGALLLWRFYSRMRRMIGRQKLSNIRPWITLGIFPTLTALLTAASLGKPISLFSIAAGVVGGVGLGIDGLKVTRFEKTTEGLFYTPSAHVGIGLSLLLAARIIYRIFQVYGFGADPAGPQLGYATTPLTMIIFGTLAGYYVTYAVGLLRWRHNIGSQ